MAMDCRVSDYTVNNDKNNARIEFFDDGAPNTVILTKDIACNTQSEFETLLSLKWDQAVALYNQMIARQTIVDTGIANVKAAKAS